MDRRLASMVDGALQIGIWDSNSGLKIDRVDADRNATHVPEGNRTRIITTIEVSRLSRVLVPKRCAKQQQYNNGY